MAMANLLLYWKTVLHLHCRSRSFHCDEKHQFLCTVEPKGIQKEITQHIAKHKKRTDPSWFSMQENSMYII